MTSMEPTYSEPTTLWRLQHPDGSSARAMLVPHGSGCSLVWWVNERIEGAEEFEDSKAALKRSEQVRAALADGWSSKDQPSS